MAKKLSTQRRIRQIEEVTSRRVAIYIRRSTDEDNQPYSLEVQESKLRAFVTSQPGEWVIVKVYSDDASGATTEREGLQQMLRAARSGLFDTLLVYRVDRFSRRLRDLVWLLDELSDADVAFCSATEPFDTSTPVGRMLVQMLGVFAEFEREVIMDRVISGMERKAAKGLWTAGRPGYGYEVDKTSANLVVVASEALFVTRVFDLYTKDRLGTRSIANSVNADGNRTRSGRLWSQKTIEQMLCNRNYIGEKNFRGIRVTDSHEPIITSRQFEQAQQILTARSNDIGQRAANSTDYTLTGKVQCPKCGSTFIGTAATGKTKRYRYYMCWTRNRYGPKNGCGLHRFNADELEHAIGDALLDFYTTGHDLIYRGMNEFLNDFNNSTSKHHDELAAIKKELKENSAATDRYLTAFEKGNLDSDDPEIRRRLSNLREQGKALRARKAQLEYDLDTPPQLLRPADQATIGQYIRQIITDTDHRAKKRVFEALIDKVEILSDGSVVPTFKVPATPLSGLPVEQELINIPQGTRNGTATGTQHISRMHSISAGTVEVTPVGQRNT